MPDINDQTVHSGHTINIKVGTVIVGRAQGIDGERNFGTEGVYEIGSMMPQEFVHNRYEGSMNLERFFVRTNDLKKLGLAALGEEVLKKGYFTIEILDKYTSALVRAYHGCAIVTYRETFRVNSIAGENATFAYLFAKGADDKSNAGIVPPNAGELITPPTATP
jgi:hypothetical protein